MTKEEILKMQSGRETDARVAVKVMNWRWMKVTGVRAPCLLRFDEWNIYLPEYIESAWVKEYDGNPPDRLPHYSTDITASWQIAEQFSDKGINNLANEIGLSNFGLTGYPNGRGWNCRIGAISATAPTAPLAICRAALLSVLCNE